MPASLEVHSDLTEPTSDYQVLENIGTGGVGIVFRAVAPGRQTVALKMVGCQHLLDVESHRHFDREAALLRRVEHPGVVRLIDHGRRHGSPYVATEFIAGRTLESIIEAEAPLAVERALELTRQILEALTAVHEAGVVHRDLKPANIMVRRDEAGRERVVLIDFGAGAVIGDVLQCNEVVGTPQYMAPEQVLGGTDGRADVFALGAVLYEMLTGRKAFPTRTIRSLLARADVEEPPYFEASDVVPTRVQALVRTALVGRRAWRHADAQTMLRALEAASPSAPARSPRAPEVAERTRPEAPSAITTGPWEVEVASALLDASAPTGWRPRHDAAAPRGLLGRWTAWLNDRVGKRRERVDMPSCAAPLAHTA